MATPSMKLLSSASEPNVYLTYVCLTGSIKPSQNPSTSGTNNRHVFNMIGNDPEEVNLEDDETTTKVEKSRAQHEIVRKVDKRRTHDSESVEDFKAVNSTSKVTPRPNESKGTAENNAYSPKLLELTRMKWLTESQDGSPDASPTLLSPTESTTSSECQNINDPDASERFLSTILRLDREHNLFGLSNMTIVGSRPSRKLKKDEDRAVFHQNAIVQICYRRCCRRKSNTQLPTSLRCNQCGTCCKESACSSCVTAPSITSFCPPIWPSYCTGTCLNYYGLEIKVKRKPKFDPIYPEKYAMSPCELHKPLAARPCTHVPRCIAPSCCTYLMPCFWPGRETAPCSEPAHCFHNPPCPKPRVPHVACHKVAKETCPTETCAGTGRETKKCENMSCIARDNAALKTYVEEKYGRKKSVSM